MIPAMESIQSEFYASQIKKVRGEKLLESVFRLLKTIMLHQSNNRLILDRIGELREALQQVLDSGTEPTLYCSRGNFYLGEEKISFTRKNFDLLNQMIDVFARRGISGLSFTEAVLRAPNKEIFIFFKVFQESEGKNSPQEFIQGVLESRSISWGYIRPDTGEINGLKSLGPKEQARRNYLYSITAVKEIHQKFTVSKRGGVRKAKRLVQNLVDMAVENEGVLLGLTTLKNFDDYTFNHSANVAVLAICLGKRIRLDPNSLMELGICGLFHDLGKVLIPKDILNKTGRLNEMEWEEIKRHPIHSVSKILGLQASHELKAKVILAPFEHHLRYDFSGYPKVLLKSDISLFGRILAVVDCYDAMTSERNYRSFPISPDRALSFLLEKSGKDFDPVILKVFVQMIGIFPVGTFLELDTGERGLVFESNPDSKMLARPRVLLLFDEKGKRLSDHRVVDLSQMDRRTGLFKRSIKRTINPKDYRINPAEYFL